MKATLWLSLFIGSACLAPPLPAQTPAPPVKPVRYEDWRLRLTLDGAEMELKNTVQGLWTRRDRDGDESRNTTELRRVRSELSGWLFFEQLTFEAQVDWKEIALPGFGEGDEALDPEGLELKETIQDAFFNWDFRRDERLQLKVGQFKTPFGRQELTSAGKQGLVDRSLVTDEFARGRDVGLMVWGWLPERKLEYFAGVFNGQGKNELDNEAGRYQGNLRLVYQSSGKVKYEEGDFQWKEGPPLVAFGGGLQHNQGRASRRGLVESTTLGLDATLKWGGLFVFTEIFAHEQQTGGGRRVEANGIQLQAGYFIWRRHLEAVLRLAELDPDDAAGNNRRRECGVGLNYYQRKHDLKLQADLREVELDGANDEIRELRVQGTVTF